MSVTEQLANVLLHDDSHEMSVPCPCRTEDLLWHAHQLPQGAQVMGRQAIQKHPCQLIKRVVGLGSQSLSELEGRKLAAFSTTGLGEVGKLEGKSGRLIDEKLILLVSDRTTITGSREITYPPNDIANANIVDVSSRHLVELFLEAQKRGSIATHVANKYDLVTGYTCLLNVGGTSECHGHWLLDEDVLAGFQAGDSMDRVVLIRIHDHDELNLRTAGKHLVNAGKGVGHMEFGATVCKCLFRDVDEGNGLEHFRAQCQRRKMRVHGDLATSDDLSR